MNAREGLPFDDGRFDVGASFRAPLGGVLVGGRSRRFGTDKALALLRGRPMVEWVVASLTRAGCAPVALLGGNPQTAERLALPWRPDAREGGGPLAGIAAGLEWAREQGQGGLLVVACDLPLVMPPLLEAILTAVAPHVDTVVARQSAPPGLQPLCAWYGVSALPHLLACLDRGERSVRDCLVSLEVRRVPEEAPPRDLDEQLLNVNTREQLEIAERVLAARVTDIEWEPAR